MKRHHRSLLFLALYSIALFLLAQFGQTALPQPPPETPVARSSDTSLPPLAKENIPGSAPQGVLVTRVVDGDTIQLETGQKVRYIGVNTPETVDPRRAVQCFGVEAKKRNQELVEGKYVVLKKDVSNTDRYGRLLRFVYVGNIFVNELLVQEGMARASTYPPDVSNAKRFKELERQAREQQQGLWSACANKKTP